MAIPAQSDIVRAGKSAFEGSGLRVATFYFDKPAANDLSPMIVAPYNAEIIGWKLVTVGSSSNCEVKIWKRPLAVPTSGWSIVASAPIAGQGVVSSTTITGWSVWVTADDVLRATVTGVGGASSIMVELIMKEL